MMACLRHLMNNGIKDIIIVPPFSTKEIIIFIDSILINSFKQNNLFFWTLKESLILTNKMKLKAQGCQTMQALQKIVTFMENWDGSQISMWSVQKTMMSVTRRIGRCLMLLWIIMYLLIIQLWLIQNFSDKMLLKVLLQEEKHKLWV